MDQLKKDFIEFYVKAGQNFFPDQVTLQIISSLYIDPEEVSLEQLAKDTGFSLATISNKARFLETAGLVKRITKPGSKRIYLFVEKDIIKVIRENLLKKQELLFEVCRKELPTLIAKYEHKKINLTEQKELHILKEYHKQILSAERIFAEVMIKMGEIHEK